MEIFINEMSLHGQYGSERDFKDAIRRFMSIFDLIHQKKAMTYKNLDILLQRKAIQDNYFASSFESIKDQSFKQAFKQIVFNKSNPKDWALQQVHRSKDVYHCEEINDFVNDTTLAEVAARNRLDLVKRVLIHFKPSHFKESPIKILRNEEVDPILLDFVETSAEFQQWESVFTASEPDFAFPSHLDEFDNLFKIALDEVKKHFFKDKPYLYEFVFTKQFKKSIINRTEFKTDILKSIVKKLTLTSLEAAASDLHDEFIAHNSVNEWRIRVTQRPHSTRIHYIVENRKICFLCYYGKGEHDDKL